LLGEPHPEEERAAVNDETDMLESLTGIPHPEDEILFAVPVCAPYATLLNYKFKGDSGIFFIWFQNFVRLYIFRFVYCVSVISFFESIFFTEF